MILFNGPLESYQFYPKISTAKSFKYLGFDFFVHNCNPMKRLSHIIAHMSLYSKNSQRHKTEWKIIQKEQNVFFLSSLMNRNHLNIHKDKRKSVQGTRQEIASAFCAPKKNSYLARRKWDGAWACRAKEFIILLRKRGKNNKTPEKKN
jgi:hypothetical protein